MKKQKLYALFTDDVKSEDKYKLTTPPKSFFKSRISAKKFMKKHGLCSAGIKILTWKTRG